GETKLADERPGHRECSCARIYEGVRNYDLSDLFWSQAPQLCFGQVGRVVNRCLSQNATHVVVLHVFVLDDGPELDSIRWALSGLNSKKSQAEAKTWTRRRHPGQLLVLVKTEARWRRPCWDRCGACSTEFA